MLFSLVSTKCDIIRDHYNTLSVFTSFWTTSYLVIYAETHFRHLLLPTTLVAMGTSMFLCGSLEKYTVLEMILEALKCLSLHQRNSTRRHIFLSTDSKRKKHPEKSYLSTAHINIDLSRNTGATPAKASGKSPWRRRGRSSNILILGGFTSWTAQGPEQPNPTVKSALLREGCRTGDLQSSLPN